MNKLSERVLLPVFGGAVLLVWAAACSSTPDPAVIATAGTGTTPGTGGGPLGSGGFPGAIGSGAGAPGVGGGLSGVAGSVSVGGATNPAAGGTGAVSGGAGKAGSTGGELAVVECPTDTNLVNTPTCWVGCDPALSTDNPQGIQGAFYTFGDGSSCTLTDPPCSSKGVCLSGTTSIDKTYAKYGCGIGMELNATGGTASKKQPYAGPASCFNYTLTGSSGGNEVRIAFTQSDDTTGKVSPYVSIPAFTSGKTGTVCIKDVSCQGQMNCAVGTSQYDLQINVVGGNTSGAYSLCLSSLVPVATGTSTLSQICGVQGASDATADVSKYFAQNNVFPSASNKLCITPALNAAAASFKVDSAMFATGATLNAYPSIVDGWHYGRVSSDTALPKKMSVLASANSAAVFTGSDGKYDAAYDMWVLPTLPSAAVKTPAGGLEVMVWLNHAGVNPAGSMVGTFMGYNVWTGTVENWNYVAYEKTGGTSFSGDLKPFLKDAITRKGTQTASADPYLAGIEFGFELYDYPGTGFAVTSFTCDVK